MNQGLANPWWKTRIVVCDKCFQASCWQGVFMCQQAYEAGTVEKTIAELIALHTGENPDNWTTTDAAQDALIEQSGEPEASYGGGIKVEETK